MDSTNALPLTVRPSHVAFLVRSVQKSAEFLRQYGFTIGPAENWEGEGTKEIYIEGKRGNSLLLMEPIQPGAYQRAMDKRGPGLHHLAIDVLDLKRFLLSVSGSGWSLHPVSERTMKATRTLWLSRTGFPALVEVQEREKLSREPLFVSKVELSVSANLVHLASSIGLGKIVYSAKSESCIFLETKRILFSNLVEGCNS